MKSLSTLLLLFALIPLPCVASRVVTDETGRRVTVPDHPHRIICLVPSITDDVFSLGAGDDVVAVSDYVRFPAEAQKKPSVGSIMAPSIETIASLHPDLILGIPKANPQASLDQMQAMGIPVFLVDPHGLAGIFRSITSLGIALNRESQATALTTRLQQRIDAVRASVRGKPAVAVLMPVWYDPVITIGKGAFITEIIEAAGGRSITADIPQEWPHISMETVIARAPEALLLVRDGKTNFDVLKDKPGWENLTAVKQRRAYYVDRRIDFPSPVAIDALEDLAKQFHP
ncbi:iron complex transport system substrate-binding protein [Granulicella pectinivorans]|uniref:Iron complex transport system substrate-binding protein n=1 Tax=Granulicella pectinivorans TaxID=474950 RepID=A0A1I6MR44_9BACT|nr:cobalamin-binding protein [Granulicella pectinivorans]SFS18104.1 iron complex transport system substrate-binding protein [Granulicella pectinivorans]